VIDAWKEVRSGALSEGEVKQHLFSP